MMLKDSIFAFAFAFAAMALLCFAIGYANLSKSLGESTDQEAREQLDAAHACNVVGVFFFLLDLIVWAAWLLVI